MNERERLASERFSLGRRLGAGGFGVVYEAWDSKLDEPVAVKFLRKVEDEHLLRFKREFRSLADVHHPNLVRLGELVADRDTWCLTMELIDGVNILAHVRLDAQDDHVAQQPTGSAVESGRPMLEPTPTRTQPSEFLTTVTQTADATPTMSRIANPFDEDRLRDAFGQLADGVNALHDFGFLHRDLKPSNVLVARDGRVLVLDFGLAVHLGKRGASETERVVGTPGYMSPEQSLGREVSAASDWYSFGVMLHEALTGSRLFTRSRQEINRFLQSRAVPRPADLVLGVPADLDQLCLQLLSMDPADRPSGSEVARCFDSPRQVTAALQAPPISSTRFVGRLDELSQLDEALERVKNGRAATVFISGPSGIGKTALVRRFLDRLKDADALVLSGRCYRRENVPYKAFDSLVDELSRHLKRLKPLEVARFLPRDRLALGKLFPVLAGICDPGTGRKRHLEIPDATELRRRARGALRELLARLADCYTVVLFIDDLQWGDVDSAALLREITRLPDPPPVMVLACYRAEEAERSRLLRTLARTGEQQMAPWEVKLAELPVDDATELALDGIGHESEDSRARAAEIARESGGIPFFVDELVRFEASRSPGCSKELRLEAVLETRMASLPEYSRRLLEVVAVAGEPVEIEVARRAAELTHKAPHAIDVLRTGHWVRRCALEGEDALEAYHDRIREAVVSMMTPDLLASCHRGLAEAWEKLGTANSETLVEHYLMAGDRRRAAEHSRRAADQAAAELAFNRAARLYRICLDAGHWESDERAELLAKLAESLANSGRGEVAAKAYLAAAEVPEPQVWRELTRRAAEQFLISGHIDEGRSVLQTVLAMVGMKIPSTPRRSLAGLVLRRLQIALRGTRFKIHTPEEVEPGLLSKVDVCWSVAIGFGMVETIHGAHFQALHLLYALRAGEPFRLARALAFELGYSAAGGSRTARHTAELMRQCRAMLDEIRDPYLEGLYAVEEGVVASLEGRYAESLEACVRSEEILREECTGVPWELDTAQLYHNHALVNMGQWKALAERVPAMLEDARDRSDLYIATYLRTRNAYLMYLVEDDVDKARQEQARSLEGWSHRGFQVQHYWDWFASGEIDLYAGTFAAAWERLDRGWPLFKKSQLPRAQAVFLEALFLRARVALAMAGRAGPAERARFLERAARDVRLLERESTPWGAAMAKLVQASLLVFKGENTAALRDAGAAATGFERIDMPHAASAALWRLGQLTGNSEGDSMIASARSWFENQGVQDADRMVGMLAPGRWA